MACACWAVAARARAPRAAGAARVRARRAPRLRATGGGDGGPRAPPETTDEKAGQGAIAYGWNSSLLRSLFVRQLGVGTVGLALSAPKLGPLLLVSTSTTGGGLVSTFFTARMAIAAAAGAVVLVALGRALESSSNPTLANIARETEIFVLALFGERARPLAVGAVALPLVLFTGLTEEIAFRGVMFPSVVNAVPPAAGGAGVPGLVAGALVSSFFFGLAHWGGDRTTEGAALVALEASYGLVLAATYVLSGYNLLAPIIAHAVYDWEAIVFPHLRVCDRIAYARAGAGGAYGEEGIVTREALRTAAAAGQSMADVMRVRAAYLLIDTDQSGAVDAEELRVALAALSIKATAAESDKLARAWSTGGTGQLSFDSFYKLLLSLGVANSPEAMVRSLLGSPGR